MHRNNQEHLELFGTVCKGHMCLCIYVYIYIIFSAKFMSCPKPQLGWAIHHMPAGSALSKKRSSCQGLVHDSTMARGSPPEPPSGSVTRWSLEFILAIMVDSANSNSPIASRYLGISVSDNYQVTLIMIITMVVTMIIPNYYHYQLTIPVHPTYWFLIILLPSLWFMVP